MLFVAKHWYNPLSVVLRFLIVRWPPSMSVLPEGSGCINLVQVTFGAGKPSTSQVCRRVVPRNGVTRDGGFFVKMGAAENNAAMVKSFLNKKETTGEIVLNGNIQSPRNHSFWGGLESGSCVIETDNHKHKQRIVWHVSVRILRSKSPPIKHYVNGRSKRMYLRYWKLW